MRSSRRMRPRSPMRASRVGWSSAENGSSSRSSSGSTTRARASAARWASPPESVRARRGRPAAAMAKRASQRATRVSTCPRGDAAEAQAHGDIVEDGRVGEERLLEDARHAPPHRQRRLGGDRRALEAHGPGGGRLESADHAEEARLARAVRPDHGQHLAVRHGEIRHVEDGAAVVDDADARELDDEGHRACGAAGRTWMEPRCMESCQLAVAGDVEDLVDEPRHFDLEVVVALGRRARGVEPDVERPRRPEVGLADHDAPASGSCGVPGPASRGPCGSAARTPAG